MILRYLPVLLVLTMGACSSCTDDKDDEPDIEPSSALDYALIQYRGRVEFGAANNCSFSMPGSSIKVRFKGTSLYATFSAENFSGNGYSYLYIITDENADPYSRDIIRLEKEEQEYTIVENLSEGEHTIEIVKKNECWGLVHFNGLRVPGGELLKLPAKKSRLIEYYGDSNPSGWSAWNDKDKGGEADTEGYFTYPGFTARSLNAEWVNFSAGGFGITDRMGRRDLTDFYDKTHIYTNSPNTNSWDFSNNNLGKKPDVIVINLGANDYYNNATESTLKEAWQRFVITQLRPEYPDPHVVLANSYGWANNEPADYLADAIEDFNNSGENNISFVKFPWLWGQDHAVISEHAGFADILSKHIAEQMDWEAKDIPYSSIPAESSLLGKTSFETSILGVRPDGWRPDNTRSSASWIEDSNEALDGNAFVRCKQGYGVHQSVDAQVEDQFVIKVWAKGNSGSQGILKYKFRNQAQKTIRSKIKPIIVSDQWQQFEFITEQAPGGTWQIDVILRAESNTTIDYDLIDMNKIDN